MSSTRARPSTPLILIAAATLIALPPTLTPASAHAPRHSPPSQPGPDTFDWVTIGSPGNRAVTQQEAPRLFPPHRDPALPAGSVGHTYRLTRTEVTATQWFDFVNAYWRYYDGAPTHLQFTSLWVVPGNPFPDKGEDPEYYIPPGAEQFPVQMSWRIAARYCNWLHNNRVNEEWAFENGVYDTSTFGVDENGFFTDQLAHHPDARYWIPTIDEWVKGMHYDPYKNGPGQDGYWLYPHSSDEPPISGLPEEGGETSAGLQQFVDPYLPVGSYPHVQSPWGLLDGSGGEAEWLETVFGENEVRGVDGTWQYQQFHEEWDRIDEIFALRPYTFWTGLRLASVVSSPGILAALAFVLLPAAALRPRRSCQRTSSV